MKLLALSTLMLQPERDEDIVAWHSGKGVTYKQFLLDVRSVASSFASCRAAALVCQDSYNFVVGLYGLLHAGARLVLPPSTIPAVIEPLRGKYDVLIDDKIIETAMHCTPILTLSSLDATAPVIDFCTSGTTGDPKLVSKSLAMFERELVVVDQLWGDNLRQGKILSTVPHQHVYGFTFKLMWALAAKHAITTETHALWESLLPEVTKDSIIVSSPAHLGRLAGLEPLAVERRPRLILSAGAPLSFESSKAVQSILGSLPVEIFGSTETGAIATRSLNREEQPWHLLPSLSLRCDNEGRMSLRTPFIGQDWIETSDLVQVTDGGFYHLGRADRIVKIEEKRINLINVEVALQRLPSIKNAAVVLLKEPARIASVVILSDEGIADLKKLGAFRFVRWLRKEMSLSIEPAGIPRLWRFVDAFPNQSMGKRRDADLIALFSEGS